MIRSASSNPHLPVGITFLERGWLSSNNVVLWDEREINWIDTGYVSHAEQTLSLLQRGWPNRTLTRIINTHLHSDHCGGNALLQGVFPGAETRIPIGQFADVVAWDQAALTYESTGQKCPRFRVDKAIMPDETLHLAGREWVSISAPGHDPHAVMLWNPNDRILITADALWENGFGIVFPELSGIAAYADVECTLNTIEGLAPLTVLPGHGNFIVDVPKALGLARSRLDKFSRNPGAHTHHALKALLKFLLLDRKQVTWETLANWVLEASLMRDALNYGVTNNWQTVEPTAARQWHATSQQEQWLATALQQLVTSGQLRTDGHTISDA